MESFVDANEVQQQQRKNKVCPFRPELFRNAVMRIQQSVPNDTSSCPWVSFLSLSCFPHPIPCENQEKNCLPENPLRNASCENGRSEGKFKNAQIARYRSLDTAKLRKSQKIQKHAVDTRYKLVWAVMCWSFILIVIDVLRSFCR